MKIPWYVKFYLWFKRPQIYVDWGNKSDRAAYVTVKRFRGVTYVVDSGFIDSATGEK